MDRRDEHDEPQGAETAERDADDLPCRGARKRRFADFSDLLSE